MSTEPSVAELREMEQRIIDRLRTVPGDRSAIEKYSLRQVIMTDEMLACVIRSAGADHSRILREAGYTALAGVLDGLIPVTGT